MRISISYPAFDSNKGVALLSQNRQFQWFNNPTYIYPVVPAYAATLLKNKGYEVFWDDGIAEGLNYDSWKNRLIANAPDLIVFESKTPVIKLHWKIIKEIKENLPNAKVVLIGDHVTAKPEESMNNSNVDYVLTGGDYDFSLAELADFISGKSTKTPSGLWYRANNDIKSNGEASLNNDLNSLPMIDRELTKWHLYSEKNGNFKFTPGTYVMAARDCWWGKCSFCSWTTLYPGKNFKTIDPIKHVDEIEFLVKKFNVREIFDDSGCFPKGEWLKTFCDEVIKRGLHKKVTFGCNMRVGALNQAEWNLLKKANFRFILIGLESINQSTLDRLKKGILVKNIEETLKLASNAGLEPHITTMMGYPWEKKKDAEETVSFAKKLFLKGYIHTLQATIVIPYPGTPLFKEAKENGWLLTEDWERYDMRESVWKSDVSQDDVKKFTQDLYKAALSPKFIIRKVANIRSLDDVKFLMRAGKKLLGHLADFRG